jgi:hypothetical protein
MPRKGSGQMQSPGKAGVRGSAQELTLPQRSKAALSGAAFLVEVAQHRRLKTVDTAGFRMKANSDRGGSLLVACTYPLLP